MSSHSLKQYWISFCYLLPRCVLFLKSFSLCVCVHVYSLRNAWISTHNVEVRWHRWHWVLSCTLSGTGPSCSLLLILGLCQVWLTSFCDISSPCSPSPCSRAAITCLLPPLPLPGVWGVKLRSSHLCCVLLTEPSPQPGVLQVCLMNE